MSISEQVNTLKELAEIQFSPHHERIILKAADTIKSLSAKLQAVNIADANDEKDEEYENISGQMSFEDFPEVIP